MELNVSEKNPICVFVAHLFSENADYQRVFEYLESRDKFFYKNTSNPDNIPTGGGADALRDELREQIKLAEILILPVSLHAENPDLVEYQMDVAGACNIPVLAIKSFGGTVMIAKIILDRAENIVDWNDRAIVDGIKKYARGEITSQWEVIEFDMD